MSASASTQRRREKGVLVLEDGTVFHGSGFGAVGKVSGEVVFNTGMVGYTESITDPSYWGQILIQTYPLIGNYGVSPQDFESDRPKIMGYVVHEVCRRPSHWLAKWTLDEFLEMYGVPGIEGVDTRMLTKKIRVHGVMLGILKVYPEGEKLDLDELRDEAKRVPDPNDRDLVSEVCTQEVIEHNVDGTPHVVLVDCGSKRSILRCLLERKMRVTQVPPNMRVDEILSLNPDGVVISNGPGDPRMVPYLIETTSLLIGEKHPILGICLGNQIIARALGGEIYKMKFGHRGQHHPCTDLSTGRCYITSQNHGYAVDGESLKGTGLEVTFINANDRSVEGVKHSKLPVVGVQWHPEASPGPRDTEFMFDIFLKMIMRS